MKVAVLSLVRDRLEYTKHCFGSLVENAGCDYDHFVLDQCSTDGSTQWLYEQENTLVLLQNVGNIGISRGMNVLLEIIDGEDYDVVVKFDNDCELTKPDTLLEVCDLVYRSQNALLSPRILGLENPPKPWGEQAIGNAWCDDVPQIGGIFLAAPARLYEDFRYNPDNPTFGGDDVEVCRYWRQQGGWCGYVQDLTANHYETSVGQRETYPEYWERKKVEMGLA